MPPSVIFLPREARCRPISAAESQTTMSKTTILWHFQQHLGNGMEVFHRFNSDQRILIFYPSATISPRMRFFDHFSILFEE